MLLADTNGPVLSPQTSDVRSGTVLLILASVVVVLALVSIRSRRARRHRLHRDEFS